MPHPIYGPPGHHLEVVTFTLRLPTKRNGWTTALEAQGVTETKRGPLWSYKETWNAQDVHTVNEPVDTLTWLALSVAQDRPGTQEALTAALTPGGFEDVALPF